MRNNNEQKSLVELYNRKKQEIINRLLEFQNLPEESWLYEILFCIITPQSSGKRCWEAVLELKKYNLIKLKKSKVMSILSKKTRFHKTKANYIKEAAKNWLKTQKIIKETNNPYLLREYLIKNVKGLGMKESSHFIRNIGKNNHSLSILDRHILRCLKAYKVIKNNFNLSKENYLKIEQKMKIFSENINIPLDHLDLLFWFQGTGEIFK